MKFKSKLLAASLTWDEGYFTDPEGISHDDAAQYMGGLLGFCGCGSPEDALSYVRDAMQAIADLQAQRYETGAFRQAMAQFNSDGAAYFMWYRLDDLGLTEHGGSVPGWLTDKGRLWLEALNEALAVTDDTP